MLDYQSCEDFKIVIFEREKGRIPYVFQCKPFSLRLIEVRKMAFIKVSTFLQLVVAD